MMERIKKDFCENAVLIGAPFEPDHQLVALYKQGIIDYDFTDDSDLIVLRVGFIKRVGEVLFWHMTHESQWANEQSTS